MSYLALVAGLALLLGGGEAMLRGAVGIARRFRLSEIFVGIAIVGSATSAPELFVSVDAALADKPDIALGNVIGSNSANLLLILGAGALIQTIVCRPAAIRRDAAMMTLGVVVTAAICFAGGVGRVAGLSMLIALAAYLAYGLYLERGAPTERDAALASPPPPLKSLGLMVAGLIALALGAELMLFGAVRIAAAAGVSERVISISMIALGTSLPELATGVVAAFRKQSDVAIGNVLGSCVFNVFGILGLTALVAPIAVRPSEFGPDAGVMALATGVVLALAFLTGRIGRIAGGSMIVLYGAYIVLLFAGPFA